MNEKTDWDQVYRRVKDYCHENASKSVTWAEVWEKFREWRITQGNAPVTCRWERCKKGPGETRQKFIPKRLHGEYCSPSCRVSAFKASKEE